MNKQSLREWAKEKRNELDMDTLSSVLAKKLKESAEYKNAENIMLFYPLKNEVNLLSLLNDNSKKFYLPRIKGNELECCSYSAGDELCESCFHTLEPVCGPCNINDINTIIVPALACDNKKYRLGYGGGFYDRLLKKSKNIKTIVCIPSSLIVESIYPENYDMPVDLIVTELLSF